MTLIKRLEDIIGWQKTRIFDTQHQQAEETNRIALDTETPDTETPDTGTLL